MRKPNLPDVEHRFFVAPSKIELRRASDGAITVGGYAAVFNELSEEIFGFRERIAPGAFAESLTKDDQLAHWNHNSDVVLGRRSAGTLRLSEDERGLAFELDLPDTQAGRDAAVLIERGDITGMSFGFRTVTDEWNVVDEVETRTLVKVRLLEVSPVGRPAYPQTDVAIRSLEAWRATRQPPPAGVSPETLEAFHEQLLSEGSI